MPEHLNPEPSLNSQDHDEQSLRALSRSPHPYHHQNNDLPHPSDRFFLRNATGTGTGTAHTLKQAIGRRPQPSPTSYPPFSQESTPVSESGTEADDEHFLKGLPAPKAKLHKGLRGRNEPLSGLSTPLSSPVVLFEDGRSTDKILSADGAPRRTRAIDLARRRKVIIQRVTEVGIVLALGIMVWTNPQVSPLMAVWGKGMWHCFFF